MQRLKVLLFLRLGSTSANIVAGPGSQTAVILKDSSVKIFGQSNYCQLGLGDSTNRNSPTAISWLETNVAHFACGTTFSVVVKKDGSAYGIGSNWAGQLGYPASNGKFCSGATITAAGNDAAKATAGSSHTLILLKDGSAKAMGNNAQGQLGIGSTTNTHVLTTISSLGTNVEQLAAGDFSSVALLKDGSIKSFGYNAKGQLGLGDTTQRNSPTAVTSLGTKGAQIACGESFTLALLKDGSVQGWGDNAHGQLGLGDTVPRNTPTEITSLGTDVVQIAAAGTHALALLIDGSVKGWGSNSFGELGLGDTAHRSAPVAITALGTNVAQIAAGLGYSCVALKDGSAKCFGKNNYGQLGLGDYTNRNTPTAVTMLGTDVALPPSPPPAPETPPTPPPPPTTPPPTTPPPLASPAADNAQPETSTVARVQVDAGGSIRVSPGGQLNIGVGSK